MLRVGFAAPLVIVTACGPPPAPAVAPAPLAVVDAGVAIADAGVDAAPVATPIDAGVVVAPPPPPPPAPRVRREHVLVHIPARTRERDGWVSCHDFGPGSRGCNPPPPERLPAVTSQVPIVDAARQPDATVIVIPLGGRDAIERGWSAAVLAPVRTPPAAARIVAVTDRWTRIAINLPRAAVLDGLELELGGRGAPAWTPLVREPVDARVLEVAPAGRRAAVILDVGRDQEVDRGWTVVLLDEDGRALRGGRGTLVRVDRERSVARIAASPRRLRGAVRARVAPPPAKRQSTPQ